MEMHNSSSPSQECELGISIEARLHPQSAQKIIVHGKFSVICDQDGVSARSWEVLKHVVLVVTRSGNYQALAPFKEVIVFEDDVKRIDNICSAFFNIDVMDHIAFDGEGDYYILCSLGAHTSNIVKVSVG